MKVGSTVKLNVTFMSKRIIKQYQDLGVVGIKGEIRKIDPLYLDLSDYTVKFENGIIVTLTDSFWIEV